MNQDQIEQLLRIMDLAKQWPEFQAIHDMARIALVKANGEIKSRAEREATAAKEKIKLEESVAAINRVGMASPEPTSTPTNERRVV